MDEQESKAAIFAAIRAGHAATVDFFVDRGAHIADIAAVNLL